MFVAKYMLLAVLALPFAELAVFVLVASWIGFGWALLLVIATSALGAVVLRRAGGSHIERIRGALDDGPRRLAVFQADGIELLVVLGGFLLLLPGFITDVIGLALLIPPVQRWIGARIDRAARRHAEQSTGVVDLEPEDWRQMPDGKLTDERRRGE